jgi:hypothetical protein
MSRLSILSNHRILSWGSCHVTPRHKVQMSTTGSLHQDTTGSIQALPSVMKPRTHFQGYGELCMSRAPEEAVVMLQ